MELKKLNLNTDFFIFMLYVFIVSIILTFALNSIPNAQAAAKDDEVTLKEYFDTRINALGGNLEIKFSNMDNQLTGLNERMDRISIGIEKLATKTDVENNRANIQDLRESRANQEGKASTGAVYFGYGLSIVIGFAAAFWKRKPNAK